MIAGNWKLHLTVEEAVSLAGDIASGLMRDDLDILVIPGFLALEPVTLSLSSSPVLVGGQNLFWEDQGAYTAEVSGPQLKAGRSPLRTGGPQRAAAILQRDRKNLPVCAWRRP